jgi:hypothetical protein
MSTHIFKLEITGASFAMVNIVQTNPDNNWEVLDPNVDYEVNFQNSGSHLAYINIYSPPNTDFKFYQDGEVIFISKTDPQGGYSQYIWVHV